MIKILIDINVFLDALLPRIKFIESIDLIKYCFDGKFKSFISANSFGIIHYILRKNNTEKEVRNTLKLLIKNFKIIDLEEGIILNAIDLKNKDFEDNLQIESARKMNLDFIITRNIDDFKDSSVQVFTPKNFLKIKSYKI